MTERICPICKSPRTYSAFCKEQAEFWRCRACGFWFGIPSTNPNLANEIGDYEDAYLQYLQPDQADRRNFDDLWAWFERFHPMQGTRLLDVGAGSGKLVRYLRAAGVAATGLEPSRALYDHFLAGDAAFTCGMLDEYRSPDGELADMVTAFDVIEHVAEPLPFLDDIGAQLRPGGLLFISTPDVGSTTARVFGRHWHFFNPYHLSYFSRRTLAQAAGARGFSLLDFRHRGRLRSVGYVIRYGSEFVGGGAPPAWASRFDRLYLPLNLFDTMYLCLRYEPA